MQKKNKWRKNKKKEEEKSRSVSAKMKLVDKPLKLTFTPEENMQLRVS